MRACVCVCVWADVLWVFALTFKRGKTLRNVSAGQTDEDRGRKRGKLRVGSHHKSKTQMVQEAQSPSSAEGFSH